MSFASIGIKTSIPATAPAATSGAVTFASIDPVNWLQVTGAASAGSGSLYLLRWNADLEEWRPYMEGSPVAVDSSALGGFFSGCFPFSAGEESFVLYDPAAAITATASAARTSSPLMIPAATAAMTSVDSKLPELGQHTAAGSLSITFASDIPPLSVNIGSTVDRSITGAITSTQTVELETAGCGTAAIQLQGTFTGTLYFEATIDDATWFVLNAGPTGGGALVSSSTAAGRWIAEVASLAKCRVRGAVLSGTCNVLINASTATTAVAVSTPLPAGTAHIGAVEVDACVLPTGAATAAKQDTGNTSLSTIAQRLAPASYVVVDTAATTLTISASPCTIYKIFWAAGGSGAFIALYDSTGPATGQFVSQVSSVAGQIDFGPTGMSLGNGLVITAGAATPAAFITIVYRA